MARINSIGIEFSISDMESYGRGWCWTLNWQEGGEWHALACRTSQDRDGLWVNGRQILGTTQFILSHDKRTAQRQILRRWENL